MKKLMKNIAVLALSALLLPCILLSCTETTEDSLTVGTTFPDYATFSANRAAWTEPASYSFTYTYAYGDSAVFSPITVTITNGSASISYNGSEADESTFESYKDWLGDIAFESITDMYTYFDEWWQKTAQEENTTKQVVFSALYTTASSYGKYPTILDESRTPVVASDSVGYGGVYIRVTDFQLTE